MFDRVAPGYDRMNRVLSLGLDGGWRRAACLRLFETTSPSRPVLDLCCGTGDLALELSGQFPTVGCDFTPAMLGRARSKSEARDRRIPYVAGDAMRLPFRKETFAGIIVGFGVRNLPDLLRGLEEMRRVLDPGGRLVILEFSRPRNPAIRVFHRIWLRFAVPLLARFAASGAAPYGYLKESILAFPDAGELAGILRAAGFAEVRWSFRAFGTVAIHSGINPPSGEHLTTAT